MPAWFDIKSLSMGGGEDTVGIELACERVAQVRLSQPITNHNILINTRVGSCQRLSLYNTLHSLSTS